MLVPMSRCPRCKGAPEGAIFVPDPYIVRQDAGYEVERVTVLAKAYGCVTCKTFIFEDAELYTKKGLMMLAALLLGYKTKYLRNDIGNFIGEYDVQYSPWEALQTKLEARLSVFVARLS